MSELCVSTRKAIYFWGLSQGLACSWIVYLLPPPVRVASGESLAAALQLLATHELGLPK
jgi:hypothetical protein